MAKYVQIFANPSIPKSKQETQTQQHTDSEIEDLTLLYKQKLLFFFTMAIQESTANYAAQLCLVTSPLSEVVIEVN